MNIEQLISNISKKMYVKDTIQKIQFESSNSRPFQKKSQITCLAQLHTDSTFILKFKNTKTWIVIANT